MFRRTIVAVLKLALRVYFRRIEVVGLDNIPRDTAVVFVLNHPNALVDPVFLLCLAPRRVSFGETIDLRIVPVGLYYTEKTTFRSSRLLYFGEPLPVAPVQADSDGAPPRAAVRELSDRIEKALREVMLHAEQEEALSLIGRAEKIFSAEE